MKQLIVLVSVTLLLTLMYGCIERNSSGLEPATSQILINPDDLNPLGVDTLFISPGDTGVVRIGFIEEPANLAEIEWKVGNSEILQVIPIDISAGPGRAAYIIAVGDSGDVSTVTAIDKGNNSEKTITINVLKWVRTPRMYQFIGTFQNNLYFLSNYPETWSSAELTSLAQGGHLVTIRDQAENDFVATAPAMIDTSIWMYAFVPNNPDGGTVSFAPEEWGTGEAFDYTYYASGYPKSIINEEQYECLAMNRYGKWENLVNNSNYYVLEIEWDKRE